MFVCGITWTRSNRNSGVRISHNKIHDLRATKLVITVLAALLKAAMCGIPTIIIRDKNTTWLESSLKIFNDFKCLMDYEQFVMCDINSIPIIEITSHQVEAIHEK